MSWARGGPLFVAVAIAAALAGCSGDTVALTDAVRVDEVPACLTWPVDLADDTYWEMEPEQVPHWIDTHEDRFGGTPQPQVSASAAWSSLDDSTGTLYRYADGTALFVSTSGNEIYFTDEERTFDAVC